MGIWRLRGRSYRSRIGPNHVTAASGLCIRLGAKVRFRPPGAREGVASQGGRLLGLSLLSLIRSLHNQFMRNVYLDSHQYIPTLASPACIDGGVTCLDLPTL